MLDDRRTAGGGDGKGTLVPVADQDTVLDAKRHSMTIPILDPPALVGTPRDSDSTDLLAYEPWDQNRDDIEDTDAQSDKKSLDPAPMSCGRNSDDSGG